MLDKARLAVRVTSTDFDPELQDLIDAALADLKSVGILVTDLYDPLINRAVMTFVRVNFGCPDNYELLKQSYDEQRAQLQNTTGYTDWRRRDG